MSQNRESAQLKPYYRLIFLFFTLNLISSILFLTFINRPVYDDVFNSFDVHAYATKGLSISAIQAQRNPPGPTSFLWMAAGVRLFGGNELRASRIAVLLSWLLLGAGLILGRRLTKLPLLWSGALLSTLVFPHSVMASATLLTEGPALLFASLGALAWTEFVASSKLDFRACILGALGGLSLGVAVTCRQYYLALLASAVMVFLLRMKHRPRIEQGKWLGSVILSLAIAFLPVIVTLLIWKGVTSPSMAAGTSYVGYRAGLGLNIGRPFVAGFYVLLYLLPLSFPAIARLQSHLRWPTLVAALLAGSLAMYLRFSLLEPGPLNSLIQAASRLPLGGTILLGLIAAVIVYNSIAVGIILWSARARVVSSVELQFALLTILFLVVEQFAVGGNIPFYDRYVLQLAPFLGLVAFWLFPKLTGSRIAVLIGFSALGQFMLWRYAFLK